MLSLSEAAEYCGLSVSGLGDWVRRGIVPGPMRGTRKWDAKALDLALDRQSGLGPVPSTEPNPLDQWLGEQNARSP
jgi:hypothetical protein